MRAQKLVVLFLLAVVAVSACGSSSKTPAASNSTSPSASNPSSSRPGGSSGANTTAPKLSGDSGSSFCDLARHDESAFSGLSFVGSTPADLKKLDQNIGPALSEAESKAPSAIKGDMQTFATAYNNVVKALSDVNYDYTKLSPATIATLGTPQVKAATNHLDQYLKQVCNIDLSLSPSTP